MREWFDKPTGICWSQTQDLCDPTLFCEKVEQKLSQSILPKYDYK